MPRSNPPKRKPLPKITPETFLQHLAGRGPLAPATRPTRAQIDAAHRTADGKTKRTVSAVLARLNHTDELEQLRAPAPQRDVPVMSAERRLPLGNPVSKVLGALTRAVQPENLDVTPIGLADNVAGFIRRLSKKDDGLGNVRRAAIRVHGRVYEGNSHPHALDVAAEDLGPRVIDEPFEDGFTDGGEFLTRKEMSDRLGYFARSERDSAPFPPEDSNDWTQRIRELNDKVFVPGQGWTFPEGHPRRIAEDVARARLEAVKSGELPAEGMGGDNVGSTLTANRVSNSDKPERIAAAAVRSTDGRVFTGEDHASADAKLRAAGAKLDHWSGNDPDGFLTNTGRFVSREQAYEIAAGKNPDNQALFTEHLDDPYWWKARGKPLQAAVRIKQGLTGELKTFSAPTHADAVNKALDEGWISDAQFDVLFSPGMRDPRNEGFTVGDTWLSRRDAQQQYGAQTAESLNKSGVIAEPGSGALTRRIEQRVIDKAIVDAHAANGGSTIDPRTGQPRQGGFAVSAHKDRELVLDHAPTEADMSAFRKKNSDLLGDDTAYIGTWFNEADGKHYIDVTRVVDNKDHAMQIAKKAKQLAIFDLNTFREIPVRRVPEPNVFRDADLRLKQDERGPRTQARRERELLEGLTPSERERYETARTDLRANILHAYSRLPRPEQFADVILSGADQRGWYDTATQALGEAFGEDAPRFAALLAATSPQMAVEPNLDAALTIWERWNAAGRPTSREAIESMLPSNVLGVAGWQNPVKALTASTETLLDPKVLESGGLLSGPKVDPFYAALLGASHRVVNDTHMARGYGTSPEAVGSIGRVLAQNAMLGNATRIASQRTGVPFARAQGQETAWSWIRALTEKLTTPRASADEVVKSGADLTHGIRATPGFGGLLGTDQRADVLRRVGAQAPSIHNPAGVPDLDRNLIEVANLRNIAQRIDAVRRSQPLYGLALPTLGAGALLEARRRREGNAQRPLGLLN